MIHKKPAALTAIFFLVILSVFYTSRSSNQLASPYAKLATQVENVKAASLETKTPEPKKVEDTKDEALLVPASNLDQLTLEPFMPKMENATLKQDLGRSTWKLLHNILARYPENPSESEKESLKQFFSLFVKVYPCGDCAVHFQKLLSKYPPQVQNKQTAALWGCHIHNKVNERLHKPIYDCTGILNDYDCGCGDEEDRKDDFKELSDQKTHKKTTTTSETSKDEKKDPESLEHLKSIKMDSVESLQRGG